MGLLARVSARFAANAVIAVSSITADTGSAFHAHSGEHSGEHGAELRYAITSVKTLSVHPVDNNTSAANINFGLNSNLCPANAGNTRGATLSTIVERNPTVSACRDAPKVPLGPLSNAAHRPSSAAIRSQTYAIRTKTGKLAEMFRVLAGCTVFLNNPRAAGAQAAPARR